MVVEHVFSDGNWALAVATAFTLLALSVLARVAIKRRKLPAWQLVLSVLALGVSATLGLLGWHDCATKIARVRLEADPPRLTVERRFPARRASYGPGELLAVGLVSLGESQDEPGSGRRQLLIAPVGGHELRSFLESDVDVAARLAESIAATFGLELQRFAGPPPLEKELPKR